MKTLTIYGASDDLIEIEGDIREEFYASSDETDYLAFSDGTVLSITYGEEGIWRINRVRAGTASYQKQEGTDADSDDYTDRVTLQGDLDWCVCGKGFVKAA